MGFEEKLKQMGAKIVYYRILRGYNQKDFAAAIGVSRQFLGKIEKGETPCSLAMLNRLADSLGVKLSDIMEGI